MSKYICTNCQTEFEHSVLFARIAVPVIGYLLGSKNPKLGVALATVGYAVGHQVDQYIAANIDPTCPACGVVLHLAVREVETDFLQSP